VAVYIITKTVYPRTVTHLSSNRARRRATLLMRPTTLPVDQASDIHIPFVLSDAENTERKKIAIWAPSHNFVRLYLREACIDNRKTRHRASTNMYSQTFFVRFLLSERHQGKPAVQAASVMLRTPPRRRPITGEPATPTSHIRRAILRTPPSPASLRPAARADPAQPAVRTMSSYHGMHASL